MSIDYEQARVLLESSYTEAESLFLKDSPPPAPDHLGQACKVVFASRTQAYREVLLGCLLARIQDKGIDIRQPYVRQGANAFSGRSLDERVVNRFLQDKRIPCSRGPYLSVFRRSVEFATATRDGLRDKEGYDSLIVVLGHIAKASKDAELLHLLTYVIYNFVELREQANVPLSRLHRIRLEQFDQLISGLLGTQSGGRFPVLLVATGFITIKKYMDLDWDVFYQGINVADTASGAGGDITIESKGKVLLTAEVTERTVDRSRIIATFNTKIAPQGLEDYLFFVTSAEAESDAKQQMRQYFAQGHEVNFVDIKEWLMMVLTTVGRRGREIFNQTFISMLEDASVPTALRVGWNGMVEKLTTA